MRFGSAQNSSSSFAQLTATLDQISNGRLIIGLGAGEAMNVEQFGISWDKPLSRMQEFTEIVRNLWQKKNWTSKANSGN